MPLGSEPGGLLRGPAVGEAGARVPLGSQSVLLIETKRTKRVSSGLWSRPPGPPSKGYDGFAAASAKCISFTRSTCENAYNQ